MSRENEMMNCEDYKKALTADPGIDDESGHLDTCVSCREYSAEMLALNDDIAAAMTIPVPELTMPDLPAIETDNVVALPRASQSFNARLVCCCSNSINRCGGRYSHDGHGRGLRHT